MSSNFWLIVLIVFVNPISLYLYFLAGSRYLKWRYEKKTGKTEEESDAELLSFAAELLADPESRDFLSDIATAVLPTSVVQKAATNAELRAKAQAAKAAGKSALTPEAHIPVEQKRQTLQAEREHDTASAREAISAGLEMNAQAFRRQQQLLTEIGELEKQLLKMNLTPTQKRLIQKSIETKEQEYAELGRPSL